MNLIEQLSDLVFKVSLVLLFLFELVLFFDMLISAVIRLKNFFTDLYYKSYYGL